MVVGAACDAFEPRDGIPVGRDWTTSTARDIELVRDEPSGAMVRHMVTALDDVQEAIVLLSSDRRVQYRNRAAYALFMTVEAIDLPESAWAQLERGRTWRGTLTVAAKGDQRRLRYYVKPLQGLGGERSHLLVAHDVTDVQRLQSIADAVSFSDNLGHFLSGIRHELGNPVNSIKTALTVLRNNLDAFPAAKVSDYLDRVLGEVGRIEYLLRLLRSCSIDEVTTLGRVAVPDLVRRLMGLVMPCCKRAGVELFVEVPPQAAVIADERALNQVMLNLVSNALEALVGRPQPLLRLETTITGDRVELAVIDNGPGMSAEILEHAIRPFYTTKPTGTGLGLVIAQRLLSTQGGRLRLHSQLDVGTRAVVSLGLVPHGEDA